MNSNTGSNSQRTPHRPLRYTKSAKVKHKFKGFTQRINELKVNSNRIIKRNYGTDSDSDTDSIHHTQYNIQLDNVQQIDQTAEFQQLYSKLVQYKGNLATLIHNKHIILTTLLQYIHTDTILQYNSVFTVLNAVISDLSVELYKNNEKHNYIHRIIEQLLFTTLPHNLRNTDLLKHIFSTISHLFTVCHKYCSKHIIQLYNTYLYKLIGHDKYYIRQFTADILSTQLRQLSTNLSQLHSIIQYIVTPPLQADERTVSNYCTGIATLFAVTLISVEHTFHSQTSIILPIIINTLTTYNYTPATYTSDQQFHTDILYELFVQLLEHTRAGHCDVIWTVVQDIIHTCCKTDKLLV